MAPSSTPHSSLVRGAAAERQRIERALAQLDQQRAALTAQLVRVDEEIRGLHDRQQLLAQLVGDSMPAPVAATAPRRDVTLLRGRALRLTAARLLWRAVGREEIHYREWLERLLEAGYAVGGKDPAASFLTNVRDSPAVVHGSHQGRYRLDPTRLSEADRQLAEAQAEFADLEDQLRRARRDKDTAYVERLRGDRDRLTATIRRLTARREELSSVFDDRDSDADAAVTLHAA